MIASTQRSMRSCGEEAAELSLKSDQGGACLGQIQLRAAKALNDVLPVLVEPGRHLATVELPASADQIGDRPKIQIFRHQIQIDRDEPVAEMTIDTPTPNPVAHLRHRGPIRVPGRCHWRIPPFDQPFPSRYRGQRLGWLAIEYRLHLSLALGGHHIEVFPDSRSMVRVELGEIQIEHHVPRRAMLALDSLDHACDPIDQETEIHRWEAFPQGGDLKSSAKSRGESDKGQ